VCVFVYTLVCARVHVCETNDANLTRNKAIFGKFCNEMVMCTLAFARVHVCETIDANLTRNKTIFGKFCNEMVIQTLQ